jgi:ParB family chromosome partitioning protein
MAVKRSRLGRGLDSLVGTSRHDDTTTESPPTENQPKRSSQDLARGDAAQPIGKPTSRQPQAARAEVTTPTLPIEELKPNPYQPRDTIDPQSVTELARSISASGMIQPIVVRQTPRGHEIVAGERRWRAARAAGLDSVPVIVRQVDDRQMLEWALIENIHREDLNAVERAQAYKRYLNEFSLTTDDLAQRLGEDRSTVTNYVRLLDLPDSVRSLLAAGRISMGHARALLGVPDNHRRTELANETASKSLSVRALENLVRKERQPKRNDRTSPTRTGPPQAHIRNLESRLEETLGTKVRIMLGKTKGSGRIVIDFYNMDDFDRICAQVGLKGENDL